MNPRTVSESHNFLMCKFKGFYWRKVIAFCYLN